MDGRVLEQPPFTLAGQYNLWPTVASVETFY